MPASAVLDSGTRRLVYLERAPGEYQAVEVTLWPRTGETYPVVAGLKEGDTVVVRGNFLLDSQAQIQGLPSLLEQRRQPLEEGTKESDRGHAGSAGSAGSMSAPASPASTGGPTAVPSPGAAPR